MKVLQGVTGQAGQPWALAEGLRQVGVDADSVSIREHKFNYRSHRFVDISPAATPAELYRLIRPLIDEYDVFHFHARSFAMSWPGIEFPSLQDIALIKLAGKKVFFHFRGQEIRLASVFRELNPLHYADDASKFLFEKMPDGAKLLFRDAVEALCDGVFVVDPELQSYVPNATVVPRALDEREWDHVGTVRDRNPRVIHAPSRRGVKGTAALLKAVENLKADGLKFEFSLVENLPHAEARKLYEDADIVVDQLRIGWYGVLAVEAMALGKPVLAYIRDDLWPADDSAFPIVNANVNTIEEQLRGLIMDRARREQLSKDARSYFMRVHASISVARTLERLYTSASKTPDLAGYVDLQVHQHAMGRARSQGIGVRPAVEVLPGFAQSAVRRMGHLRRVRAADGNRAAFDLIKRWAASALRPWRQTK